MAKIALIVGSVRQDRQGIKVARWMEEKLRIRNHMVFFIDPLELNLPAVTGSTLKVTPAVILFVSRL